MIPDPQDMNSGQWTIDGRGLHPFSLAERGPLGGGGGSSTCYRTLSMGCSEIRPVTVQNREFPPLRPMYVLTFDNKVRLPQEV